MLGLTFFILVHYFGDILHTDMEELRSDEAVQNIQAQAGTSDAVRHFTSAYVWW